MNTRFLFQATVALIAAAACQGAALAQQVTGTLGSASATTTITGKQLPPPDPAFGGVIKDEGLGVDAVVAAANVPPEKAPNILLIMTDDQGFGAPTTFGGVIPTPAMDRIATERAALHQLPLDGDLFLDPGRADHRAQPPFGRLRRGRRGRDRFPGL